MKDLQALTSARHGGCQHRQINICKTTSIVILSFAQVMAASIVPPTMPELTYKNTLNYEQLSRAVACTPIAELVTCLVGGLVCDRLPGHCDLVLSVSTLLVAVSSMAIPLATDLVLIAVWFVVFGLASGITNVMSLALVILLWEQGPTTAIMATTTARSLGSLMGPLVTVPFLGDDVQMPNTSNLILHNLSDQVQVPNTSSLILHNLSDQSQEYSTKVHIPYIIAGCVNIPVAVSFLLYYVTCRTYASLPATHTESKTTSNHMQCKVKYNVFWFIVVASGFLFLLIITSREFGLFFFPSIAVESSLSMSQRDASILTTIFFIAKAASRLLTTFLSRGLSAQVILFGSTSLSFILYILLFFYGLSSVAAYYILLVLISFISGPIQPVYLAWTNRYIQADGTVNALLQVAMTLGVFIGQYGSGAVFEAYGTTGWLYLVLVPGIPCLLVLVPLQVYISRAAGHNQYTTLTGHNSDNEQDSWIKIVEKDQEYFR